MRFIPRDYQIKAVDAAAKAVAEGNKRILIVSPTASGKSVIIALMLARILKRNPTYRVLVLCHEGTLETRNRFSHRPTLFFELQFAWDTIFQEIIIQQDHVITSHGRTKESCGSASRGFNEDK